jgi:hypothetical protein
VKEKNKKKKVLSIATMLQAKLVAVLEAAFSSTKK